MQAVKENLWVGRRPRRIVIGMVKSTAHAGKLDENPYNFAHNNLDFLAAFCEGFRYPSRAIQPYFEGGNYLDAFQTVYEGTGLRNDVSSLIIDRDSYAKGYTLFVIHLSPGEPDSSTYDLVENGNIRLEMRFKKPLPNTITVIAYAEFQSEIRITRDRNVLLDY